MQSLRFTLWSVALLLLNESAAAATTSPYAGWQGRSIKALSAEQIEDLINGRGMQMALPAELNGYPGPRHVLDLAGELNLSPDQLARTRELFQEMQVGAVALGERIVEREASLDLLFASGTASEAALREIAAALGRLSGELRAHHLSYHLAVRDLLSPRQIEQYQRLRGYASATEGDGRDHDRGHTGHGEHK